ncbi:hypothetical protein ABM90_31300 [Rhodococcus erythropolis]|nr:hypothetical protein ABM90_31300 [Rhodococcus erythropolis]
MSEIRSQATPARDELAADIFRSAANIDQGLYEHEAQELANRLIAAGWSIVHCHTGGITVLFTPGDVG